MDPPRRRPEPADALALVAPFAILSCGFRWELVAVATVWSLVVGIGLVLLSAWFPKHHPLAVGPGRFAAATVAGLLPFAVVAFVGTLAHWSLGLVHAVALVVYGLALVTSRWRRIEFAATESTGDGDADACAAGLRRAAMVLAGCVGLLVAIHFSHGLSTTWRFAEYRRSWAAGIDLGPMPGKWWVLAGVALAAGCGLGALLLRWFRGEDRKRARSPALRGTPTLARRLIPIVIAAMPVVHSMRLTYLDPGDNNPVGLYGADDVMYVAQTVDARHGLPLGAYEPTLGTRSPQRRADASPIIAPIIATLSQLTSIEPVALHHSLLGPIVILWSASALWALLFVTFARRRDLAWLGVTGYFLVLLAGYDFPGSLTTYSLLTPVQGKSLHMSVLYPAQLATVFLLVEQRRAAGVDLGAALAVGFLAHLVHPFGTITGAFFAAVAAPIAWLRHRAVPWRLGILFALHLALGLEVGLAGGGDPGAQLVRSDRVDGEIRESRDLVRIGDRPEMRQYPQLFAGGDLLTTMSVMAIPLCFAIAWRRREFLVVAVWACAAIALCHVDWFGRALAQFLPPAILWRARWLIPSPILVAAILAALYSALRALLSTRLQRWRSQIAFPAAVGVLTVFAVLTSAIGFLRAGPPPARLSKLHEETPRLVKLLGGTEASAFVWSVPAVVRELPQVMPHVRLVMSQEKTFLARTNEEIAAIKQALDDFQEGEVGSQRFRALLDRHPIDAIVIPRRHHGAAQRLADGGWEKTAETERFELWRR